jgi:signal transduction histidine kinase/nitroreductase/ActR/RegA family two-component response regulator
VRITRLEPGRLIEFVPTFWLRRLVLPRTRFSIEPPPDGAKRVVAEIHLRAGSLAARLVRRELDAEREHMQLEGINLKRLVEGQRPLPAGESPSETSLGGGLGTAETEARVQCALDARCFDHQRRTLRRSLVLLPLIALWACLFWQAGLALPWLVLWLAPRVAMAVYARRFSQARAARTPEDTARGLAAGDRLLFLAGLHRAAMTPVFFIDTNDVLKLLFTLFATASTGASQMSASGRVRAYLCADLLPQALLSVCWMLHGGVFGWALAGLVLLVLPGSVRSVLGQRKVLEDAVRQSLRNQDLATSLAIERDRAQAAGDARTRFFAAASHDLRQPLHALSINATTLELLARRAEDPRLRELSGGIGRALAQTQGLLDALLDISRLDAGAVKLQWGDHDVDGLLQPFREEFEAVARQRGLGFALDIDAHPSNHWARTDADQLQRIVRNLLDNAFKFTESGEVCLGLASRRSREGSALLCISVSDTGRGIPAAERERVFEEFYQLGNPARDRSRGLGLGLAIVRRTAAMLGAQVHIAEAEGGRGTRFELTLPALTRPGLAPTMAVGHATAAQPMPAEDSTATQPSAALGVLLVDDEADILSALSALLQAVGWHAHAASYADAALAFAADPTCRIDVALVDQRLPQGDGIALVQRLRTLRPELPVLIVTGDVAVQWEVLRHGLRVLHKPLAGAALTAALAEEVAAARRFAQRLDVFTANGHSGQEPPMNLIDVIHGRRSVRSFTPQPVPREVLEDLAWHAVQVPMAPVSDDNSWALVMVEGRQRLARHGEQAKRYAAEHQPTGEPWSWPAQADFEVFWGAPVLVLFCARQGHPEAPFDCCRAGQNLALAAHARGLGSCWVGSPMPWLHSDEGRAALGLPAGFAAAAALVLGTPTEAMPGRSRPRPALLWR